MTATITPSIAKRLMRLVQKLLPLATEDEKALLDEHLAEIAPEVETLEPEAKPAPKDPETWLRTMFPQHFRLPFAQYHKEFWARVWKVELHDKPEADVEVWPRGTGKTTNCEAAAAMVGVRGKRRYILYVRRTQARADDAVSNIARLLESKAIAEHYPKHGQRSVGKFGKPGEWRRNRLRTAGGLTIDAIGLDTASRGVKIDDQRPDMIILDDIDEPTDSTQVTAKKLVIIKSSLLPAGSANRWAVGVQNLITRDGVFSQLVKGTADMLADRHLSGPIQAIDGLKWRWGKHPKTGQRAGIILSGTPTWPEGKGLEVCQAEIFDIGISTFLKECQHDVFKRMEGVALRYDVARHTVEMTDDEVRALCQMRRVFGGVDFGHWRFGFTLWAVDRTPTITRIDEYFAQNVEGQRSHSERAQAMHYLCEFYGLGIDKTFPIWGDAANPQDIFEMNQVFTRGWIDEETGEKVKSKLRIVAVARENKLRKASVDRLNDLLDRDAIKFRKIEEYAWLHAQSAENPDGTPLTGSRLQWEMDAWSFPVPKPGEPQEQDPDDETADGADMIATMRYAVMSYWSAAKGLLEFPVIAEDRAETIDYKRRKQLESPHAVDLLNESRGRRSVSVRAPRPRMGKR